MSLQAAKKSPVVGKLSFRQIVNRKTREVTICVLRQMDEEEFRMAREAQVARVPTPFLLNILLDWRLRPPDGCDEFEHLSQIVQYVGVFVLSTRNK
jgi:hypothetical protein